MSSYLTAQTPGVFDLWIQKGADPATQVADDVGDAGSGSLSFLLNGTTSFTVSETAGTGTDLNYYWRKISCYNEEDDFLVANTPPYLTMDSLTFDVDPGQSIYCIITNADTPTAVTVLDASAAYQAGKVVVSWETQSEGGATGFKVLRSLGDFAAAEEVGFKPAVGGGLGDKYQWEDGTVELGKTYFYWVLPVDSGEPQLAVGPMEVTVGTRLLLPVAFR